jgi:hypothetical protein
MPGTVLDEGDIPELGRCRVVRMLNRQQVLLERISAGAAPATEGNGTNAMLHAAAPREGPRSLPGRLLATARTFLRRLAPADHASERRE